MPNNYFQFKQFTIWQDKCAMKVCTDACLFGAIISKKIDASSSPKRVLDIGSGTGLLSLMFAQQQPNIIIDAIEVDKAASIQAKENFEASPWSARLYIHHAAIQDYNPAERYSFIFSNPPFFENDLKSDDVKRNVALHSAALSLQELLASITRLLDDDGEFAVLLPYHRSAFFEQFALGTGFHLTQRILVKQTPNHNYFRTILFFARMQQHLQEEDIVVLDSNNTYTLEFTRLLKDYYLKL